MVQWLLKLYAPCLVDGVFLPVLQGRLGKKKKLINTPKKRNSPVAGLPSSHNEHRLKVPIVELTSPFMVTFLQFILKSRFGHIKFLIPLIFSFYNDLMCTKFALCQNVVSSVMSHFKIA